MGAERDIVKIDEALCNGCGVCVSGCHEGALQLIDGKARMISELYCDGLGACIGECPVGAITIERRVAEPYDELAVMKRIAPKGEATIVAHLRHLRDHGEEVYLQQGLAYLASIGVTVDLDSKVSNAGGAKLACGCPGSMERSFAASPSVGLSLAKPQVAASQLRHWPVQLHLVNPQATFFQKADVVLAADCAAYAYADFHNRFLSNRSLAIACPKLDSSKERYLTKLVELIDSAHINTLTVVIMEVPCCGGLFQLVQQAVGQAASKLPVKKVVVGVQGDIKEEYWV